MHHPGVILLTETSACIILPSACIILPSSCHHPSPPAFPVLIHRLLSNCHRLASSCHHPVVILLSPCNFIDCNRVSSIRNDLHWFYMLLIDSHTLLLHFMFLNTVIDFHCVFIDLMICWPVSISFFIFLHDFHCDWIISVHIVSQLVWLTCVVASFFFRGHPGIILPGLWQAWRKFLGGGIILASSCPSSELTPSSWHHPGSLSSKKVKSSKFRLWSPGSLIILPD